MSKDQTFYRRMMRCAVEGDFTVADLSSWFDRPYHTVWFWVRYKRNPRGSPLQTKVLNHRIALLEKTVEKRKGVPIPVDISGSDRPKYIAKLRHDLETGAI